MKKLQNLCTSMSLIFAEWNLDEDVSQGMLKHTVVRSDEKLAWMPFSLGGWRQPMVVVGHISSVFGKLGAGGVEEEAYAVFFSILLKVLKQISYFFTSNFSLLH